MATTGGSKGWSGGRRSNDREESDVGAAAAAIDGGGARRAAALPRWPLAPLRLLLARGENELGGTRSDRVVQSTWRRGEAVGATACHPYAGDGERLPRGGRGLSVVVRWRGARAGERAGADAGRAGLPS
jgi:hypothetical protein